MNISFCKWRSIIKLTNWPIFCGHTYIFETCGYACPVTHILVDKAFIHDGMGTLQLSQVIIIHVLMDFLAVVIFFPLTNTPVSCVK